MDTNMKFSVLMSSYVKDNPDELRIALKSIWDDQTVKPAEIVIVKDGPLTHELDTVIAEFAQCAPVKTVPLPQNVGLGRALAVGLTHCSCDYVARMDGDDISVPDRFEKQCDYIAAHSEVSICGGMIVEFKNDLNDIIGKRELPLHDQEIKRFIRARNPFNHVAVFFKREMVLRAGNYEHILGYEDYYLWCRVLAQGGIGANLPDVLVYVRAGENMLKRRRGWKLAWSEVKLAYKMWEIGILPFWMMCRNLLLKPTVRFMPVSVLKIIYSHLREK